MHEWVQTASPLSFVLMPTSTTPKHLFHPLINLSLISLYLIIVGVSSQTCFALDPLKLSPMGGSVALLPWMFSLLHFFLIAAASGDVQCPGEKKILSLTKFRWKEKTPLQMCWPQKSRREKDAIVLEMKHHSYCSRPVENWEDKTKKLILSDEAQVRFLQSRIKNAISLRTQDGQSEAQIPVTSGVKLQTLNYIVTIELGGRKMTVIVDTGSDLSWVQCKPCIYCYNQQEPLFDPSTSPSYQSIPCSSPTCSSLQVATRNPGNCGANRPNCNYAISYGDGSFTRGELAREKINLAGITVEDFIFGCGRSNRGLFGGASGLMGLGRSQLSLISQTSAQFGQVFSYCLPSREYNSSGSLTLGGESYVYKNSTPIAYTRMISDPQLSPYYLLNLTGMSLGGVALQATGFSNGRILIDSGTVITRLVPSIYNALRTEFLKQFSGYPMASGFSILDTCFTLAGYDEVNIPTLKLQMEGGAEVSVDVTGMFYFVKKDASQVCLALASLSFEDELGIIGNYQQKNMRVVYDTIGSKLGFAEETCGYT